MIYTLNYNTTTPVDPEVQKTISSTRSSLEAGKNADSVIEDARKKVADMIGSAPHEIMFTTGGTVSNKIVIETAIWHFYATLKEQGDFREGEIPHIITSNIEHDSIRCRLEKLVEKRHIEATFVATMPCGTADVFEMVKSVKSNTCLITLMLANPETGAVQMVELMVDLLRPKLRDLSQSNKLDNQLINRVLIHTDASQALGKIEVSVDALGVDYLTISGHKFYGPRIGALYFRRGRPLCPHFNGGGQIGEHRSGTENTCMIAGLGKAAELVTLNLDKYSSHMLSVSSDLIEYLSVDFDKKIKFANGVCRLPNTVCVAFNYDFLTGEELLAAAKKVLASTGSNCHSDRSAASSVLVNSGVSVPLARRTLLFSVGRETKDEHVKNAVIMLGMAVKKLESQHKAKLAKLSFLRC